MDYNPVKGTHDIFGEDMNCFSIIRNIGQAVAYCNNYQLIETPILEHTNLFARSVGDSSDIVTKEMYTFEDKGGRSVTLRPELTAGVMRSIVSNKLYANEPMPLRYSYFGPCFRYERPQAGRYRQFYQYGFELLGASNYLYDAEMVTLGWSFLSAIFDVEKLVVKINCLGGDETRAKYREALKEYFKSHIENMCEDCKHRLETNPLRILDCKVPEDREIIAGAPKLSDFLSEEEKIEFKKIELILKDSNVKVELDQTLVRGLDYYSGLVFEYHINDPEIGESLALGGGGHYNHLLEEVGGPALEGVGLSFGVERLINYMKHIKETEEGNAELKYKLEFYAFATKDEYIEKMFTTIRELNANGFRTELSYEAKSMGSQFKAAVRKNAKFALIIGDDEVNGNFITVKNLLSQEQTKVEIKGFVKSLLSLVREFDKKLDTKFVQDDILGGN